MRSSSRVALCAAFAIGPVLLASGCGEQAEGARTTLVDIQPTSYVLQDPVTTTTTTSTLPTDSNGGGAAAEGEISPVEQQYTIQGGDNQSKIATLFGITIQQLQDYNGWTDGNEHLLLPGTVILIPPNAKLVVFNTDGTPAGSGSDEEEDDAADAGDTAPPSGCLHTIESGENPSKVADKYEITLDQLRAANANNAAINSFVVGQQLLIPPEGNCPAD